MGDRETEYKSAGVKDVETVRRSKKQQTIELRKKKRSEKLLEKRMNLNPFEDEDDEDKNNVVAGTQATRQKYPAPKLEDLPKLAEDILKDDIETVRYCATQIRRLLSSSKHEPPLKDVIACGVVPRLVQLMACNDDELRVETAWTLTNLASGTSEQTRIVVEANSVPIFIELLRDSNPKVSEQAMWALGNIAGDSAAYRDLTMQHNVLEPLLAQLTSAYQRFEEYSANEGNDYSGDKNYKHTVAMMQTFTWALSNLCRSKNPPANLTLLQPALPLLARLISVKDKATVADACWAWTFISDLNMGIDTVIRAGVPARLVELLSSESRDIISPTLRTIGNILGGDEQQTQTIINLNALPSLRMLVEHPEAAVRKDACWALSNITAGSTTQVHAALNADVIPGLIRCMGDDDHRVKKEAAWAVANAAHISSNAEDAIGYLVRQDAIRSLVYVLGDFPDPKTMCVIILGLEKFLKAGKNSPDGINPYATELEECDGPNLIWDIVYGQYDDKVRNSGKAVLQYFEEYNNSTTNNSQHQPTAMSEGYHFQDQNQNQTNEGRFNF